MRILTFAAATLAVLATHAEAADLALRHVMLSSAGVGYFEYEAEVDGPASLGLDVRLDQVDDVLKSLVVFDAAGSVGGIELPGRDQGRAAFGDVPLGPEGLASPLAFLNSLQGVEVTVQGPRPMTGRVLRAETAPVTRPGSNPEVVQDRTRVSLLTDEGLQQFVLEEADSVQVADPALRGRIGGALSALRRETARDARHITIRTLGAGRRTVRVSYVAAAPLWKASYRLVLPPASSDPAGAKARLQGWATLENATGTDWSGVSLSLQYGNPVTFRQAIYRSYFVQRPEVPVEVLGRLLPDVDTRARTALAAAPPPPPPSPAPASAPRPMRMMQEAMPVPPPPMAAIAEPVAAQEGTEETLFTIPVPVTLGAGHSASVPILDGEVPASRVALVRQGQAHPLSAIQVENTTAASLPAGVLTLYDAGPGSRYAGDARLGGVPAGETRLIAFAQDLRTTVAWRQEDAVTLAALTAADGVLTVDRRNRQVSHATVTAPVQERRRVLLEVDKSGGAKLAADFAQPASQTESAWRFAMDLRPGETRELTYALDRNQRESITLLEDDEAVLAVLNQQGTSPAARAGLQRIAALRKQEAARTADRDRLVTQREAVESNEERLRANLAVVPANDALRTRLIRQLDADETRHAQLSQAIDAANAAVTAAHQALVDGIAGLRL